MRIKTAIVILAVLLAYSRAGFAQAAEKFLVVIKPVADIRAEPKDGAAGYGHDDLDETQVLYNEILRYRGENAQWYQVEAVEQREFSHQKQWQGYPGWVKKENARFIDERPGYSVVVTCAAANVRSVPSSVSEVLITVLAGTKFKDQGEKNNFYKVTLADSRIGWIAGADAARIPPQINRMQVREQITTAAKIFLGVPYVWGGRSMRVSFLPEVATGVDCSGLVNLAYRMAGVDINRDAYEQWMATKPVIAGELKPADLIFLSQPGRYDAISHVMLSLGGEDFIEAPGTGSVVRASDFKTKFGLDLRGLRAKHYIVDGRKLYFGRMIP